jgi:hypothetical protein
MKTWLTSLNGVITLSMISLLVFLARTFFDFYYVYTEFNLSLGMTAAAILINTLLFSGWIWSQISAAKNNRRGLISIFVFNLFFLVVVAVGTLVSFCPSPCGTAWPMGEIFIWASLVFGMIAAFATGIYLRTMVIWTE